MTSQDIQSLISLQVAARGRKIHMLACFADAGGIVQACGVYRGKGDETRGRNTTTVPEWVTCIRCLNDMLATILRDEARAQRESKAAA